MNEVQVDIEQSGAAGLLVNDVVLPNLVEKRFCCHSESDTSGATGRIFIMREAGGPAKHPRAGGRFPASPKPGHPARQIRALRPLLVFWTAKQGVI